MATASLENRPEEKRDVARTREPRELLGYPFGMMRRISSEMDRVLEDFGFRPHLAALVPELRKPAIWSPNLEIFERKGEFVVRAELPGMTREDVKVHITDEYLTLEGERKYQEKETREDYYRSECSYGTFARTIPLPQGAKGELAQAIFKNGILEVTMPLPPRPETKSRAIEVKTA
jgi:HSP20 family protein